MNGYTYNATTFVHPAITITARFHSSEYFALSASYNARACDVHRSPMRGCECCSYRSVKSRRVITAVKVDSCEGSIVVLRGTDCCVQGYQLL